MSQLFASGGQSIGSFSFSISSSNEYSGLIFFRNDRFDLAVRGTLKSPLDCKEIKLVHPKGGQSWVFIGRTDAEAETPNSLATSCEELTSWKRL